MTAIRSFPCPFPVIINAQTASTHGRAIQRANHRVGNGRLHFDDGEAVADIDAADLFALDARLTRDGTNQITWSDVVARADTEKQARERGRARCSRWCARYRARRR